MAWAGLAASFAVALAGFVGDRWFLTGDWAAIDLRIREVGGPDSPLIGPYSTRGWAHPGPALYWLAAPLHHLSGGGPRSMFWTAAVVNLASLAVIARVAWRRLGSGFAVVTLLAAALLAHGLGPGRIIDIWNPLLPLFPLLAVIVLAWSGASGRPRHGAAAVVLASLVGQSHVGMVPILVVIAVWALGWAAFTRCGLGPSETTPGLRHGWRVPMLVAGGLALLAWLPVAVDQVARVANLGSIIDYFLDGSSEGVGLGRGTGLVSRYVRPDGPWLGGPEPLASGSVVGSGAVPLLAMITALAIMATLAWRRRDGLVAAGTSLALVLVLGSVPIAANVDEPVFDYLVKWLEVVSAWAWLWLAWGGWCLVRGRLDARLRTLALPVGTAAVLLASVWSMPAATTLSFPGDTAAPAVAAIRTQLEESLPAGEVVQVEHRGDSLGLVASGVIYWLWRDGVQVVSTDGATGLKYGPDVARVPASPPDGVIYTVAVRNGFSFAQDAPADCAGYPGARRVAAYDSLRSDERAWLDDFGARNFFEPASITGADRRRAKRLTGRDLRVSVWAADATCASGP